MLWCELVSSTVCFVRKGKLKSGDAVTVPCTRRTHDFTPLTFCVRVMTMNNRSPNFIFCSNKTFLIAFLKGPKSDLNA